MNKKEESYEIWKEEWSKEKNGFVSWKVYLSHLVRKLLIECYMLQWFDFLFS